MTTPSYTLAVENGPLAAQRFPVTHAGLRLGRSSQCEIAIHDPLLSRNHCRFELRDDALWVIDLASANQTLVNDKPVDEKQLSPGDRITVGETTLIVGQDVPASVSSPLGETEPPDVVIDLGFGRDSTPAPARKEFLRPFIWLIAAFLILVLGRELIDWYNRQSNAREQKTQTLEQEKSLLLHYEKVEASTDNIFRYEMILSPEGTLSVKIDDLSGKNRHVRKEKKIDPALVAELAREIEISGFFTLEKTYTGFAAHPNTLNEWTLTAAIGKNAHSCRVSNRQEPEIFRALREKIETFSKNELGIWAIQFSTEKLTVLARDALAVARKKFDEREVKFGNLFESIRSYQEAVFYLDTVNPKPDFYAEIIDGFEAAESELSKRYEEQRFRADRAINLSDWPTAARELRILCELIPDRADTRNKEASRKLIDVENRLGKNRR